MREAEWRRQQPRLPRGNKKERESEESGSFALLLRCNDEPATSFPAMRCQQRRRQHPQRSPSAFSASRAGERAVASSTVFHKSFATPYWPPTRISNFAESFLEPDREVAQASWSLLPCVCFFPNR